MNRTTAYFLDSGSTSLEGHLAALKGGISINMREMNQVLEVNADDMDVRAQVLWHVARSLVALPSLLLA